MREKKYYKKKKKKRKRKRSTEKEVSKRFDIFERGMEHGKGFECFCAGPMWQPNNWTETVLESYDD